MMSETETAASQSALSGTASAPHDLTSGPHDLTSSATVSGTINPPEKWTDTLLNLDVDAYVWTQRRKFILHIVAFILAPTLLAAGYVGWYATPRYVSEFQILYHASQKVGGLMGGASAGGLLSSLMGSGSEVDMTRVISAYLASKAVIDAVQPKVDLKGLYSRPEIDWLDRLSPDAPSDKLQDYFNKRVSVHEENGGFITVNVEGFTPESAQSLARALADAVDAMVSRMNNRPKDDMVAFTKTEMERTEKALVEATNAVTTYRERHSDYDLTKSVGQLTGIVGGLQSQLADTLSQLQFSKALLGANAPQISVLNARIAALSGQIKAEHDRLASSGLASTEHESNVPYSKVMAEYESLLQAQEFARQLFLTSRQAYEGARADAARKDAYVVSFVPPNLPDRPTSPSAIHYISTAFFASLVLYAIASILIGLVRDQTGI